MIVEREGVTREEVIRFYAAYDLRKKKGMPPPSDVGDWPWDDAVGLDRKLRENGLKSGVLAAYRTWQLVKFDSSDLLDCAIVDNIFPGAPQALSELVSRGKVEVWSPHVDREWWGPIRDGKELGVDWALIARPSVMAERPAKRYLEDGSGRGLAFLQRILRCEEFGRTAFVYLGREPDERSSFIASRPELSVRGRAPHP
jgi:hypothetical protein